MAALDEIGSAEFQGLADERDVSAIARLDSWLVVGADEGAQLSVLSQQGDGLVFAPANSIELTPGTASEIDIEGAAFGGGPLVRHRITLARTEENQEEQDVRREPREAATCRAAAPRDQSSRCNLSTELRPPLGSSQRAD